MVRGLFASVWESLRHRVRPRLGVPDHRPTHEEECAALDRHNATEARVVGRTMADPDAIRATGKGRPR